MSLAKYVERKNSWNAIFGKRELDVKNAEDRQRIAQMIDADLSPENLTCDGELSRSQVQARYAELTKAAKDLYRIDPTVKFSEFVV
jgi:hypothetical protein